MYTIFESPGLFIQYLKVLAYVYNCTSVHVGQWGMFTDKYCRPHLHKYKYTHIYKYKYKNIQIQKKQNSRGTW